VKHFWNGDIWQTLVARNDSAMNLVVYFELMLLWKPDIKDIILRRVLVFHIQITA
jgi:hypothetical protein